MKDRVRPWLTGLCLVLIAVISRVDSSSASRIVLGADGGYRGIVVKILPSVREDACSDIIKNIKGMLSEGSAILHTALQGRAFFSQVTIVVPPEWTETLCGQPIKSPTGNTPFRSEDIVVGHADPLYGSQPYTEQSRPCGQPGDRIRLADTFLTDLNATRATWGARPGKLLVREWAKLRYGIFSEHGFADDPVYPLFHQIGDIVLPTATTNAMVRGNWIYANGTRACDPTEEATTGRCYFKPEGPNEQVSCSLGYLPELAGVRGWCEPAQLRNQPMSPTKHNVLCGGRSVLDVIRGHADFASSAAIPAVVGDGSAAAAVVGHELRETEFDVVRQPPPEYVLLVETSSGMAGIWKWVRKALQNLVRFEMVDNSRVAIITFAREARLEQNLAVLTSERVRIRVADAIPDNPKKLSRHEERCLSCAIQVAMDQVLRNREAGGHLIIISQGDAATLSTSEAAMVAEYDKYYNVRMSSVLVPQRQSNGGGRINTLDFYAEVAARSGGRSLTLTDTGVGLALLSDLILSLREVVSVDSHVPVTVHSLEVARPEGVVTSHGQFLIDATLGRDTRFGVFVEDDEDHRIKAVRFTDETGKTFGPYTKMSSDFDIINYKTINFGPGDQPPFDEVGKLWQYQIDWYPDQRLRHSAVVVTSRQRDANPASQLAIKVWTHPGEDGLIIVYAKVSVGEDPVQNALAEMEVLFQTEAGTILNITETAPLRLLDDGFGDPDLLAGDGVYSRHLTWRLGPGVFYLKLTFTDNLGAAYTAAPGPSPIIQQPAGLTVPVCCGSRVIIPAMRRKSVGLFLRNVRLAFAAANGSPPVSDTIPPAKIGNFAVRQWDTSSASQNLLGGSWTAVGDNYHDGEADHYRIFFAPTMADLLRLPRGRDPLPTVPFIELTNTDKAGSWARHNFSFDTNVTGLLYLAVQAVDSAGNGGQISNPVRVLLVDLSPNTTTSAADAQANGGSPIVEDWTIIGIVVGIIAFVLLTLVTLVLCLLCWRRGNSKRASAAKIKIRTTRSSGVNVHIPSPTRSDATDVSYESEHQLVPAMSKPPLPPPSSTSFANNITPTYWSASQLLSEHEQRTKSLERKVYRDHYSGQSKAATATAAANSQNNSIYNGYTVTPYSDAYGDMSGLVTGPPAYRDTGKNSSSNSGGAHLYNNNSTTGTYADFRHRLDYGTVTVTDLANLDGGDPVYGGGHLYSSGSGALLATEANTTLVADSSDQGDYGSDLVDEGMGASGSSTKSRVNISDASSATLPMFNSSLRGSLMSLNSNLSKKRHMTQV